MGDIRFLYRPPHLSWCMPKYVTSSLVSPIATHEDFCGVRPTISLVSVEQQDTGLRKFGEIPNSEAFRLTPSLLHNIRDIR